MTEPTSVLETRVVHDMHRLGTTMLAEAARRTDADPAALEELRLFLVKNLRHHHESEDDRLWPLLERLQPGISAPLHELSGEHEELDRALDALESAPIGGPELADTADAVREIIHRHLDHEEPVLFPALEKYVTEQAWAEFSAYVIATTPPDAGHLAIGFFDRLTTPAELEVLLAGLPEPVKPLVPMLRKQAEANFAALGVA